MKNYLLLVAVLFMMLYSAPVNQHDVLVTGDVLCSVAHIYVLIKDRVLQSAQCFQSLCRNLAVSRFVESVSMFRPFTGSLNQKMNVLVTVSIRIYIKVSLIYHI